MTITPNGMLIRKVAMAHDPLRPINRQKTIKVLERAVSDPAYPPEPKSRARRSLRLLKKVEALRPQRPPQSPNQN